MRNWAIAVLLAGFPTPALAYIGPGLGAGAVAVILGILGSIILAMIALFWYPLKRLLKRSKRPPAKSSGPDEKSST